MEELHSTPVTSSLGSVKHKLQINDSGYFTPSPELSRIPEDSETLITPVVHQRNTHSFWRKRQTCLDVKNDETDFFHIPKNGSHSKAVKQIACPTKLYLEADRLKSVTSKRNASKVDARTLGKVTPHPIGLFIGREHIDFIKEFNRFDLHHIVSYIVRTLTLTDLLSACGVSKIWKQTLLSSPNALRRWKLFMARKASRKENDVAFTHNPTRIESLKGQPLLKEVLQNQVVPSDKDTPESTVSTSLFTRFTDEAKSLQSHETLDKCPRCLFPARVNSRLENATCSSKQCSFNYCIRCRCEYRAGHKCDPLSPKIGCATNVRHYSNRQVRKNLHRLLT